MIGKYINMLLKFEKKKLSSHYQIIFLSVGATVFLVIVPLVLAVVGRIINSHIGLDLPYPLEIIVGIISTVSGLFFLTWSVASHWLIGKGTPTPIAPTQNLVVVGPYKLCRNPIQLGGILYYLGFGIFFDSFAAGLFSFLVGLIFGSIYHKLIEEKELFIRFGEEYTKYKERTPFLIPRRLPRKFN